MSIVRVDSLIERAEYLDSKGWHKAKACALQDAIKYLYNSIYKTELEKKTVKKVGATYRKKNKGHYEFSRLEIN